MKRIFHPWYKWECFKAGFYNTTIDNLSNEDAKIAYRDFLSNLELFESALNKVLNQWPISCEHFLSNPSINHIAWLGQSSACIELGLPSKYRSGFSLMTSDGQKKANQLAEVYYIKWKKKYKNTSVNGENKDIQMVFQI